jgi:1,4-alpha-glucan branching enzyme
MKMRRILLFVSILIFSISKGQIVTLTPAIVTQNDSVLITFDATQGNAGLAGVSQVYAHTGVITNLSSSPTDWRHVQGNWGTHDPKVQMTNIGNDLHTLKIHIDTYYNVPSNETVSALAFVFRNVDGSKEGKTASNGDIFVPISQGGFTGGFTSHLLDQYLIAKGDTMGLEANVSDSSSMKIYMNGSIVAQSASDLSLNYDFISGNQPANQLFTFILEANNGTQTIWDTISVLSRQGTPIAPLPSYAKEGIQYLNDSTVYFQIRAPFKSFIYLIGDFNNWRFDPNYQLNKTPNGAFFWIEISGLDKNTEYGFQYVIDEEQMRVSDPYVEKILDPWNDQYIPSTTYPNLKPYPTGKTTDIVGVFQIEDNPYNWATSNFVKPDKNELVIYELLIRDFHQDHDYAAVIDKLDYLNSLGVNAIELMPIMEFEGNESWGYNPSFMFAPDKYYGPKNELKRLVDSCHSKGMAVLLDIALNHSFGQSPMVRMYFDPNAGQWGQPTPQNPWFNEVPKHDFNVGYDFDHSSDATEYYSKEVFKHWIEEYQIDGYRLDLSKGFTQNNTLGNVAAWNQYDQQRIDFLKDYANTIWNTDSAAFVILEHFADNSEETVLSNDGQMLWGNSNHEYNEATMGYASNLTGVSHQSRNWSDMHLIGYMESHDEERLMYKTLEYGNSNNNYSTKDLDTALQRMALASAFFYTIPGPKMLWQFGELGYDYSINHCPNGTIHPDCRVSNKPIRWDYYSQPNRQELYSIVGELNHLRRTNPVFSHDANHDLFVNQFTKRIKLSDTALQVVIIGNFDITPQSINPAFHNTGWWYDHFSRDSMNVTDVNATILLEPGEWHIYTSKSVTNAISVEENPSENAYIDVFPNPFNDAVHFRTSDNQRIIKIEIFNIAGQNILQHENTSSQSHFSWNGNNQFGKSVEPGMYIYHLTTSKGTYSGKLLKP